MNRIRKVIRQTENRFLNLYALEVTHRDGKVAPYYVASRISDAENLKAVTGSNFPDGVVIFSLYGDDRVVLIRQFRYPAGDYVYELPAGLIDAGESTTQAAVREMKEETGLTFTPLETPLSDRAFYTSVGLTDESCCTVFGHCSGDPSNRFQEISEDIQVLLADRNECRRILKEEKVSLMCAYLLMHFIDSDPFAFLQTLL